MEARYMSYTRKATASVEAQAKQLDRDYARTVSKIMAMRRRAAAHERMMAGYDDNRNQEIVNGDLSSSANNICSSEKVCNHDPMMARKRFRAFQQGPNALEEKYRPKNIPAAPTVSTLTDIIGSLDALANYCEKCGNKKLAESIDVVSNTLELENNEE